MKQLFSVKGFLPYILVVFLNAFMDLGHKIMIQNTVFKIWDGQTQIILTAIVNGLILLPYVFLFTPSGFLSDKYPKHIIMRYGALMALVATVLITICYYMGWFWAAFSLTLLMAIQSAIYSPAKYGYIKELLGDERLAQGNAVVQSVTIVSILSGTFVFSGLFETLLPENFQTPNDILLAIAPLGFVLIALALCEVAMTFRIPLKYPGDHTLRFHYQGYVKGEYLKANIQALKHPQAILQSIVGLSMFWAVSQVVLASFPAYAKEILNENNTVMIQGILACTGIGIIIGSVLAGRFSRAHIEVGLIPFGAIGITLGLFLIPMVSSHSQLAAIFLLLGVSGGLFIVPLNALIQYLAQEEDLGTVLAGNNWIQNIVMISFLVITAVLATYGITSVGIFYGLGFVAFAGAVYTICKLPHSLA